MNSTKWSRPAQQSESAYLQAALRVLRSTHTHTFEHACTQTHSLRNANFSFYSILKRKMRVVCVCVCETSVQNERSHWNAAHSLVYWGNYWTVLLNGHALPSTSIHLTATHSTTNTETNWCTHLRVCVCAFITYFVGMCVFAITQWEEHQLLSIKTLALKKLLHFKLQT